jgi:hypothetical protein
MKRGLIWFLAIIVTGNFLGFKSSYAGEKKRKHSIAAEATTPTLTYKEVLDAVFLGYPSIQIFREKTAAARDRATAGWLGYAPSIKVGAGLTYSSGFYSSYPGAKSMRQNNLFYGLTFTLFDGGAIAFGSKALESEVDIAELNSKKNINDLAVQASEAYAGVLMAENYLHFLEHVVEKLSEYAKSKNIEKLYGREFLEQISLTDDLYKAKLIPAKQNLESQKNLLELVAVDIPETQMTSLEPLENLLASIIMPKDMEAAVNSIPETIGYQIADHNVVTAKFQKYATYAKSASPIITAQIGQQIANEKPNNDSAYRDNASIFSLNVNYNLSPSNYYSSSAAAHEHEAAKAERETLYRNSEYAIRNAYIKLKSLSQNYNETKINLDRGLQRLADISERIEQGENVDLRSALGSIDPVNEMWLAYANSLSQLFLARTQMSATYGFFSDQFNLLTQ